MAYDIAKMMLKKKAAIYRIPLICAMLCCGTGIAVAQTPPAGMDRVEKKHKKFGIELERHERLINTQKQAPKKPGQEKIGKVRADRAQSKKIDRVEDPKRPPKAKSSKQGYLQGRTKPVSFTQKGWRNSSALKTSRSASKMTTR